MSSPSNAESDRNMTTNDGKTIVSYQPLRTGDYDEEEFVPIDNTIEEQEDDEDITTVNIDSLASETLIQERRAQQDELLSFLEASMDRLSRMSLHISNEIDASNHNVEALEVETDDIQYDSQRLIRQQRQVERSMFQEHFYFCLFFWIICLVLLILIAVKFYYKYYAP